MKNFLMMVLFDALSIYEIYALINVLFGKSGIFTKTIAIIAIIVGAILIAGRILTKRSAAMSLAEESKEMKEGKFTVKDAKKFNRRLSEFLEFSLAEPTAHPARAILKDAKINLKDATADAPETEESKEKKMTMREADECLKAKLAKETKEPEVQQTLSIMINGKELSDEEKEEIIARLLSGSSATPESKKAEPEDEEKSKAKENPEAGATKKPEAKEAPKAKENPEAGATKKPEAKEKPEAKDEPKAKEKPKDPQANFEALRDRLLKEMGGN